MELAKLILPGELFEHFEIVGIVEHLDFFDIRLDERNNPAWFLQQGGGRIIPFLNISK